MMKPGRGGGGVFDRGEQTKAKLQKTGRKDFPDVIWWNPINRGGGIPRGPKDPQKKEEGGEKGVLTYLKQGPLIPGRSGRGGQTF